jgi:hypothetical protein
MNRHHLLAVRALGLAGWATSADPVVAGLIRARGGSDRCVFSTPPIDSKPAESDSVHGAGLGEWGTRIVRGEVSSKSMPRGNLPSR